MVLDCADPVIGHHVPDRPKLCLSCTRALNELVRRLVRTTVYSMLGSQRSDPEFGQCSDHSVIMFVIDPF